MSSEVEPNGGSAAPQAAPDESLKGLSRRITALSKSNAAKDAELAQLREQLAITQKAEQAITNGQPGEGGTWIDRLAEKLSEPAQTFQNDEIQRLTKALQAKELASQFGSPFVETLIQRGLDPKALEDDEFVAALKAGLAGTEVASGPLPHSFSRSVGPSNESLEQLTRNFEAGDYHPMFDGAPR
jgi:hypothetical protein